MKLFTKQEILALGIIFGILLVISIPNFALSIKRARDVTRKDDLFALELALKAYEGEYREFPTSLELLSLKPLPNDPQWDRGISYLYLTNGHTFQLYGSLELTDQDEYDEKVVSRNLACGIRICNFGRSYGNTPLDKSIEEYENELIEK